MPALAIAVSLCVLLGGCRLEFAAEGVSFVPTVGEVETLLAQDRVRQALQRAKLLTQQYRGPEASLVHGWAAWRNGEVRQAEAEFRRSAATGLAAAQVGLATVRASNGDWEEATRLAREGLAAPASPARAHALLASAAWIAGDAQSAADELRAWSLAEEPGSARGHAAASMAAATSRLRGRAAEWTGTAGIIELHELESGGWAVEVLVDGRPALVRLDLTYRQSVVSESFAAAAELAVDGQGTRAQRAPSFRWPGLLSARQAAVTSISLGSMTLNNFVVAVADVGPEVDGVLAADALTKLRWSLLFDRHEMGVGPASAGSLALPGVAEGQALAWVKARLVFEGLAAQLLLLPRVAASVVAAGVDIGSSSRLDVDDLTVVPGSNTSNAELMVGGWKSDITWRVSALLGWAIDGGIAPSAVLGDNVLDSWALHWYPTSGQLRIDAPPAKPRMVP